MTDFKLSLQKGLDAYDAGERAKKEIFDTINEAARQIVDITGGALSAGAEVLTRETILGTKQQYRALVIRTPNLPIGNSNNFAELFSFKLSQYGYPVTIMHDDNEIGCHNRSALEEGLSRVLADPDTGGEIRRLLARKP